MRARTAGLVLGWISCFAFSWLASPALSQIATDGTIGPKVELSGPDYAIVAELGRRAGGNLFHSFERFDLRTLENGTIEGATFSGPPDIENVISRVTGGERSDIDGTLRSTIPGADFFFINPAGVVFGPNASLDVQGSFHVSAADELRFSDGAIFSAVDPSASSLTIAAPEAFGFLGAAPAAITVDRSVLEVPAGEVLSIIGGDITIDGGNGGTAGGGRQGLVRAQAGRIDLAAVGGRGEAGIDDGEATAARAANITLKDQAHVSTNGDGGGSVRIWGGALLVDGRSFVSADNTGSTDASGGIEVAATEQIEIRQGSAIRATTSGDGDAGSVTVDADRLLVSGGHAPLFTGITSESSPGSSGNGGIVTVNAGDLTVLGNGQIRASTFSMGNAGTVTVEASRVFVADGGSDARPTGIFSDADQNSTGRAGGVTVGADEIRLRSGGQIRSLTFGEGDAGTVDIDAHDLLLISTDGFAAFSTGILSSAEQGSSGKAGDVTVTAGEIALHGGQIRALTFGDGDAGNVSVEADRVFISGSGSPFIAGIFTRTEEGSPGNGGNVIVTAGELEVRDGGLVSSESHGSGDAGSVTVAAGDLTVLANGQIRASTFGRGNAGTVTVEANRVLVADGGPDRLPTGIFSDADENSTGRAGGVTVGADEIRLRSGGQIRSVTFGEGDAGTVEIDADDLLLISADGFAAFSTGILSSAEPGSSGRAGEVTVTAGEIALHGGEIRALTFGNGDAGNVSVDADRVFISGSGSPFAGIFTRTEEGSPGSGGNVTVTAREIVVRDGGQISSETRGTGNAGAVTVSVAGNAEVKDGGTINSSSQVGRPGAVRLDVGRLALENGGKIVSLSAGQISDGDDLGDGDIVVNAHVGIMIFGQPGLVTGIASSTFGARDAGAIHVRAPALEMSQAAVIDSSTAGNGNGGPVTVEVGDLVIGPGAFISSISLPLLIPSSTGNGGRVRVVASQGIVIEGDLGRNLLSGVTTTTATAGAAGTIVIETPVLRIAEGGQVSSGTVSSGRSGAIDIDVEMLQISGGLISTGSENTAENAGEAGGIVIEATDSLRMSNNASVSAETARSNAGNIVIRVGRLVDLADSAITTSAAQGDGGGGNIRIDPQFVVLDGSRIVANAQEGAGGNIRIVAENFIATADSLVDASSEQGIDGTVVISSPDVDLTGGLVALDVPLLDAASQLRERCAARRDIGASSFTGVGRGGLPPGPDQPLMSDYLAGTARGDEAGSEGSGEDEAALPGAPTGKDGVALAPVLLVQACAGAL